MSQFSPSFEIEFLTVYRDSWLTLIFQKEICFPENQIQVQKIFCSSAKASSIIIFHQSMLIALSSRVAKGVPAYGIRLFRMRVCVSCVVTFCCLNLNLQDSDLELANQWAQILIFLFSKNIK